VPSRDVPFEEKKTEEHEAIAHMPVCYFYMS